MPTPLKLLLAEDNAADAELVLRQLRQAGYEPDSRRVDSEAEFVAHLSEQLDLVISDYRMPQFDGLRALRLLRDRGYETPFIIVSGTIGEERAVDAMQQGATDYLLKDRLARLGPAVSRALETGRRKREYAEAEHQWQNVFAAANDAILVLDGAYRVLDCNEAAVKLYGQAAGQLVGMNLRELRAPDERELLDAQMKRSVKQRGARWESRHVRRDGTTFPVDVSTRPFEGTSGRRFVHVVRDVTARKRGEEALRKSRETLRAILDAAPVAILGLDRKGRLTEWNAWASRVFGWTEEEAVGRYCPTVPDDGREAFAAMIRHVLTSGPQLGMIHQQRKKNGETITASINAAPLRDEKGRQSGIMVILEDVTERQQAEADLRRAEQQLHALVGRLQTVREEEGRRIARELHDDLGQNLTALKMDIDTLAEMNLQPGSELQAHLARMYAVANHTVEVVQKISGELRLGHLELLGLPAAIEWQLEQFQQRSGLDCVITRMEEIEGLRDDQATAIYRVTQEVLTNIARHAGATRVELALTRKAGWLRAEIRDNGRGITAEERVAPTAYGLLGMRERVQALGGRIEIEGAAGRGTQVVALLPVVPP